MIIADIYDAIHPLTIALSKADCRTIHKKADAWLRLVKQHMLKPEEPLPFFTKYSTRYLGTSNGVIESRYDVYAIAGGIKVVICYGYLLSGKVIDRKEMIYTADKGLTSLGFGKYRLGPNRHLFGQRTIRVTSR